MDREAVEELFAPFGRVVVRRMFSGQGVYVEDACFALALQGTIWLKADPLTKLHFVEAGCKPFTYRTATRTVTVDSFWSLPEAALDDEDALRRWCGMALEAGRKTAAIKAAAKARATDRLTARKSKSLPRRDRDG